MGLKKTDILFRRIAGERVHRGIQPGKTALLSLFHPFVRIVVAVENDAFMIVNGSDDQIMQGGAEIGCIFKLVSKLTEAFRDNGIQYNIGIGNGIR